MSWWKRLTRRWPRPASAQVIERCWRLRTQAGQHVTCVIVKIDAGFEVRAGFVDDVLLTKRVGDLTEARAVAIQFRRTLINELGGVEVPLDG